MWIAIVAVAVLVLVAAAYAGLGKLGEMPDTAVTDRPKGIVPSGPITREFLAEASLPTASSGYSRPQVDAYLAEIADGVAGSAHGVSFDVVRHGYDMQVIDELSLIHI